MRTHGLHSVSRLKILFPISHRSRTRVEGLRFPALDGGGRVENSSFDILVTGTEAGPSQPGGTGVPAGHRALSRREFKKR